MTRQVPLRSKTPLRTKTPLRAKTPLKRHPRRYTAEERERHARYVVARMEAWKRDQGKCQFFARAPLAFATVYRQDDAGPLVPTCDGPVGPHHIYPQQRAKREGHEETITDSANIVLLCRTHHNFVDHVHPELAKQWGLLSDQPLTVLDRTSRV